MKTLDEVKGDIEPLLKQQKAQELAQKEAEAVLNQARAQGLDAAAAAKSISVITSDYFGRKDLLPGIGPANQFMDSVFGTTEKSPPDMAPLSQGFVVYQLLGVKPPSTPTFEEIRSKIEEEFKNERANALLSQKTQELSDRAKAEHDLKRAAKELGATVKTSDFVAPDGQVPDLGSMTGQAAQAFIMKPGEISGPINSGSNGVVLALLESQQPADTEFAAKRDQIREQLLQNKQQEIFGLFVSNLRDQMEKSGKIKINQEEMKALTHSGEEGL
jgi:peptidyl-prolyl cis-trans isomerase D